jgi:hypothetical protein
MALWTFRDFTDDSGQNVIAEWTASIRPERKRMKMLARWDAHLEHIQNIEQASWPSEWFTELRGHPQIFEMKFTVNNIQWRPLGYFGPARHEFTFLIGAIERNDRFEPTDAPRSADARRLIVEHDPKRAIEHE